MSEIQITSEDQWHELRFDGSQEMMLRSEINKRNLAAEASMAIEKAARLELVKNE